MYFSAIRLQKQYKEKLESVSSSSKLIFFVGMMGSGKTTIGRVIAQMLEYNFLDMDARIEIAEGMSVKKIFAEMGEAYFRTKERNMLYTVSQKANTLISCGGGTFISEDNIKIINDSGVSVFLNVSRQILEKRLAKDITRPVLNNGQSVGEILETRMSFYQKAKIIVDITKSDLKTNVIQCIEALYRNTQEKPHV